TRADLDKKRATMNSLLKDREKLYASAETGRAAAARDVERLAAEARNLRDLLAKIEEDKRQKAARPAPRTGNRAVSSALVDLPGLGKAQIPAAGLITVGYGETDAIG